MIKQLFFYDIERESLDKFRAFSIFDSLLKFFVFCLNFSLVKKVVKKCILTTFASVNIILFSIAYVYHELYIFIYSKKVDFKYSDKKQIALKINTKSQLSYIDNTKEKYLKTAKNLFSENKRSN